MVVVPTPSGEPFTQAMAAELATRPRLLFACGRYEGIDQRVMDHARTRWEVREVSIGDYVLNGGEVAALVVTEAVVRLLPGFMGNPESLAEESHGEAGLLEYPVYTKPPTWRGLDVPEVLFSGHHAQIARWRRDQALRRTAQRRPRPGRTAARGGARRAGPARSSPISPTTDPCGRLGPRIRCVAAAAPWWRRAGGPPATGGAPHDVGHGSTQTHHRFRGRPVAPTRRLT